LTESELKVLMEDFQRYYSALAKSKNREYVSPIIDILQIWKEAGQISEHKYREVLRKIKTILYDSTMLVRM